MSTVIGFSQHKQINQSARQNLLKGKCSIVWKCSSTKLVSFHNLQLSVFVASRSQFEFNFHFFFSLHRRATSATSNFRIWVFIINICLRFYEHEKKLFVTGLWSVCEQNISKWQLEGSSNFNIPLRHHNCTNMKVSIKITQSEVRLNFGILFSVLAILRANVLDEFL